jgi:hypothetical protein
LGSENHQTNNENTGDSSTDKIRLKKPKSAGRYQEVKKELTNNRKELADYSIKLRNLAEKYPEDNELEHPKDKSLLHGLLELDSLSFTTSIVPQHH